jgi:phosphatidate cytidylyltransferase
MLTKRTIVSLILLPIGLIIIHLGDWPYALLITLILALAAREYVKLFKAAAWQPSEILTVGGVVLLALSRLLTGFAAADWIIALLLLLSMGYHLFSYERGRDQAASDFAVTVAGIFYIGWLGSYMISLRQIPDGEWWLLTVLVAVWLADSAAYLYGSRFGKHKLSPRLSPKKTWEGYIAGVVASTLITPLFAALWRIGAGPDSNITMLNGLIIGLVISILTTLGDLGESMIKRQVGAKDSSQLIPGHGGVLDRIDSWIWAASIGYYMVMWLFV